MQESRPVIQYEREIPHRYGTRNDEGGHIPDIRAGDLFRIPQDELAARGLFPFGDESEEAPKPGCMSTQSDRGASAAGFVALGRLPLVIRPCYRRSRNIPAYVWMGLPNSRRSKFFGRWGGEWSPDLLPDRVPTPWRAASKQASGPRTFRVRCCRICYPTRWDEPGKKRMENALALKMSQ